jgi:hypothetical protein
MLGLFWRLLVKKASGYLLTDKALSSREIARIKKEFELSVLRGLSLSSKSQGSARAFLPWQGYVRKGDV